MLGKLLKYDLKANFKFLSIFYVLALISAVLTRICFSNAETLAVQILGYVFNGLTISMIANILINNLMRVWVYFKKNLYGDEGYLMHTLPVKRRDLFASKYLMGFLTMLGSTLVVIVTLAIAYLTPESFEMIKVWLSGMEEMIIPMTLLIFLEFLAMILAGFLGIITGHRKLTNRTGFSVLFGFVFYLAMQQIVGIGIVILSMIKPEVREALFTSFNITPTLDIMRPMIVTAIIVYTFDYIAGYYIAQKSFKKIDLD